MSCAETRPTISSSAIGTSLIFACSIARTIALLNLRPSRAITSPRLGILDVAADPRTQQMVGDELLGVLLGVEVDDVLLVVVVEQVLGGHPERAQQHGRRKLAAPVDTHVEHVARIEFEIDPAAAIRNDSRRVEQLAGRMRAALVVLEEHAGRAMQLRDDDALGAVHHEGAVTGHQRNLAEVDFLLLDVLDRAAAVLDVPDDELNLDLERRGVSHAALMAFLDVVLGRAELVADELERRGFVEILDRKDRLEDRLQTYVRALLGRYVRPAENRRTSASESRSDSESR